MQVGMIGLFEVVKKYDVGKGVSFEIYVGICICGVMFDEVCKGDWVLCLVYCNMCMVIDVICMIEVRIGCDVKDYEVVVEF